MGLNFCTIVTDDDYNLNTEDTIKVVRPEELYYPNDNFVYSMPVDVPIQQMMTSPQMMYQNQNVNPIPTNSPNIHFAPVIKIVNDGNDMSQQLVDPQQPPDIQMIPKEVVVPLPDENNNNNNLNTNEIDFSIPIIKK